MPQHTLNNVSLTLPDDGPTLDDVHAAARVLGINLDRYISRAVIALTEQVQADQQDPTKRAWLESNLADYDPGEAI